MNFGQAIEAMNNGGMVARSGWNGKNMFIFKSIPSMVTAEIIQVQMPNANPFPQSVRDFLIKRGTDMVTKPFLVMYTAQGELQPGWLASQADMLAEDWMLVNE